MGFSNLLHELRLNELWHFPCHFHQLRQCHGLEAISGIYPDFLIPYFLALDRISTHATYSHSRYELREIRHLQMAVIQIVHQEIGISSNLVALIIEITSHHHLTLDIASRMQWQRAITSPVAILTPLLIASYMPWSGSEINYTNCSATMVPIHALQWYRFTDTVK